MEYKTLDMGSYKRKQHFEYFSGLAFPYVGTTAPVDITALREKIRRERLPFFFSRSATARRGRRTACRSCAGAF
ncbi:MAG: CatA-like O-acetyltransferase [Acutalibacteraceae bacterium]